MIVLLVASAVSLSLGDRVGGLIIIAMVLLSVLLNFFMEFQARHAVEEIRKQVATCAVVPHRMVRGIPGHADAGGVRDPDGGQPAQEPSRPILADQRAGRRGDCRGAAVYAARDPAAVRSATRCVAGRDRGSRSDVPPAGAGRQDVVLSSIRDALGL